MKKIIFKVSIIAAFLISSLTFAQEINKVSLLNELNNTSGVELNTAETTIFESINKELVSELFNLEAKKLSKDERDSAIDKLFDKRDKSLTSSLGINKYSDIKSKTDAKIAETTQKIKQIKIVP